MIRQCASVAAACWLLGAAAPALAADALELCLSQPSTQFIGFDRQNTPLTIASAGLAPRTRTLEGTNTQWPLPSRSIAPIIRSAGPAGGVLLFEDDAGDERYRLLYQTAGGTPPLQLSAPGARVAAPLVLPGAGNVVFTSTAGEGRLWGVLERSESASTRIVFQEAGAWQVMSASADGDTLLVQEIFGLYDRVLYTLDRPSGLKTPIFIGQRPLAIRGAALSPDGRTAYVMLANTSKEGAILKVDIYAGKVAPLLKTQWPPYAMALSARGDRLIAFENRNGETWVHSLDLAASDPAAPLPLGGWAYDLAISPSGADFGYTLEHPGSAQSARTQSVILPTPEPQAAPCAAATLSAIALPRKTPVANIQDLPALLIEPTAPALGPRPVLIAFHGGPEGQWRKSDHRIFFALAEALDIAILLPNVAGSTGYGLLYSAADDGATRSIIRSDILQILTWLKTQPNLDHSRVATYGASYGGYAALYALSQFNDDLAGAVSEVGISHLPTFLAQTPITRRSLRRAEYGDERTGRSAKALDALSPSTSAKAITQPVFLIHGENDARVPVNQSTSFASTLQAQGTPVTLRVLPREGHLIRNVQTRLTMAREVQAFLKTILRPERTLREPSNLN